MTIHVYLDVDGVLLPIGPPHHDAALRAATGWPDWRETRMQWYSPAMLAELTMIAALPGVTFHWVTTWSHSAATDLPGRVGFAVGAAFNVLDPDHYWRRRESGLNGWWKRDAVLAHMTAHPDDRFVWCDDDLDSDPHTRDILIPAAGPRLLAVCPDTSYGLTQGHLAEIRDYIGRS